MGNIHAFNAERSLGKPEFSLQIVNALIDFVKMLDFGLGFDEEHFGIGQCELDKLNAFSALGHADRYFMRGEACKFFF